MNICLFTKEEISKPLSLKDERAIHIVKVLHKQSGDSFTAGIIDGKAGKATIQNISENQLEFTFTEESEGKLLHPLIMIIGFPRPIQLKRLLRDIAALGVSQVHLTGTELGEKSYLNSTLSNENEARKMLIDGSVQAGSTHIPEIFIHKNLNECMSLLEKQNFQKEKCVKLCLDNIDPEKRLFDALETSLSLDSDKNISYLAAIGSERGWTNKERKLFKDKGYTLCSMGERIMRTETACTVAASVISSFAKWI